MAGASFDTKSFISLLMEMSIILRLPKEKAYNHQNSNVFQTLKFRDKKKIAAIQKQTTGGSGFKYYYS